MRYRFLDWNLNELGSGVIEGDQLDIPNRHAIFVTELTR